MAGTAGLEPANAGIKTPCLNQLGDVPAEPNSAAAFGDRAAMGRYYNDFVTPWASVQSRITMRTR
jgi:hypothetical protein